MDAVPFGALFRVQEDMYRALLDLEKVAEKAIEDEIAAGGTGKKAKMASGESAQNFLSKSRNITQGSQLTVPDENDPSKTQTVYQTRVADSFRNHQDFVRAYLSEFTQGKELGHIGIGNITFAAELYLGKMDKDDPRRPRLRYIIQAFRTLDATAELVRTKGAGSRAENMEYIFDLVDQMDQVDLTGTLDRSINVLKDKAGAEFTLMYEEGKFNNAKGKVAQGLMEELRKVMEGGESIVDGRRLSNVTGSKTLARVVKDQIIDVALGKPIKDDKVKKKSKQRARLGLGMAKKKAKLKQAQKKQKDVLRRLQGIKATTASTRPPKSTGAGQADSLAPLMAILNQKLPQTVVKNMGPPGLQNQTGRFASSVKVTDVSRTAQGFPSVGYTYQKNPYQVFEMGQGQAPWADPDRDPRKLIDASIREIAAQFAIGRFYTRRI